MRPTLPHPDLSPLLDAGARNGLRLELSRDVDGKPVDVLDIDGGLEEGQIAAMEELLWHLIPEAKDLRGNVGQFTDARRATGQSHVLALSQLMITYHMVKAALGEHAL